MRTTVISKSLQLLAIFLFAISCDILKENPADANTTPPAQVVVQGTLTEEGGGALASATISIGSQTQTTNSAGIFYFGTELTDGNYSISVSKTGYYTVTRSITVKKDAPKNLSLSIFKKSAGVVINSTTGGTVGPLTIPANGLTTNTEISVTNILGAGIPDFSANQLIIAAYALEPNGLTFKSASSLQTANPIAGINSSIIKAQSIGASGTEELNITTAGNSMTVPVNHFSYIYFYISSANFRYSIVDSIKTVETTVIASCSDTEKQLDITLTPRIVTNQIAQSILASQIGNLTSRTVTLKITRSLNDQLKQLTYQLNNKHYIFELNDGTKWSKVAEVVIPEATVIPKNVGPCHNQGGVSG